MESPARVESWLHAQIDQQVGDWQSAIESAYPDHWRDWSDPEAHVEALKGKWNTLAAAEEFDWESELEGSGLRILDLGAGTGWLSALISRVERVERIDALDSSRHNLETMLPKVVELLGGEASKIHPILGLFTPLQVGDATYEYIVESSSLHHASSLPDVLKECRRVLKPQGRLYALNEVPLTRSDYVLQALRMAWSVAKSSARTDHVEADAPAITRFGLLYDPILGDRSYSESQWAAALASAGFGFSIVRTGLSPEKGMSGKRRLAHFVCTKKC